MLGMSLIISGLIFIILGATGIVKFVSTTIEINNIARLIDGSPGLILVIIGWFLIKGIKVTIEKHDDNVKEIIIGFRTKK